MDISIPLPAIRTYNWEKLYSSIEQSTKMSFEVIFVGPYTPPKSLAKLNNVHFIKDFGSPTRCENRAILAASCQHILFGVSDDALMLPNAIDENFKLFQEMGDGEKNILACKYFEGPESSDHYMLSDVYYTLNNAVVTRGPYIKPTYLVTNVGFFNKSYFEYLGGFESSFQSTAISHADFAVRCQHDNANVRLSPIMLMRCGHMEGTSGDHAPMHYGQTLEDEPLFAKVHNDPTSQHRIIVDIDSWKKTPDIWQRRFSNGSFQV